jgi:hypothetical protein
VQQVREQLITVRDGAFDDEPLPRNCDIKRRDLLPAGTRKSKSFN